MGKEIQVAMSVVGMLVLLFCGLLYIRISGSGAVLPEVAFPAPARFDPPPPTVHSQPTIVRGGVWGELTRPIDTRLEPTPEARIPSAVPDVRRRAANPRRVSEVELTSAEGPPEFVNPREASRPEDAHELSLEPIRYPDLIP